MNRRAALSLAGIAAVGVVAPVSAQTPPANNLDIAKTFVDQVLNARNVNALDAIVDANMAPSNPGDAPGADAFKARVKRWIQDASFADDNAKFTTESTVASGDDIVVRGYITGASRQGKVINSTYFVQFETANGMIKGCWFAYDFNALMA